MTVAERLGLRNEFPADGQPRRDSIAFLRRHLATAGDIQDDGVLGAAIT